MRNQTSHLSPAALFLALSLIVSSWLLFRSPLHGIIIILGLCIPGLLFLPIAWLISRYRLRRWWLPVRRRTLWWFWLGVILLVVAIPLYTYYAVGQRVDQALEQIGIQAKLIKREVHLLDELSDVGDVKRVVVTYELQEPLEQAAEKLRAVTIVDPEWKVWQLRGERRDGTKELISIQCDYGHVISLDEDRLLTVIYRYGISNVTNCYLPG